jgi:hypothetical protein
MRHPIIAAALISAAGLLSGCVAANPYPPVPPPRPETIPPPPVTGTLLLWQPGHWNWTGDGYVWEPGEYVPRDGHSNLFMPGYWQQTAAGRTWVAPHWM